MAGTKKTPRADLEALLYALNALDPSARAAIDRRRRIESVLDPSIESWEERLAAMLPVVPEVRPRVEVWDRITMQLDAPETATPELRVIHSDRLGWETWSLGLEVKVLTRDPGGDPESFLMRMEAGAVIPEHLHDRVEECLVIEGDLVHDGHELGPGDFTIGNPGGIHSLMTTRQGGLLYIRYLAA